MIELIHDIGHLSVAEFLVAGAFLTFGSVFAVKTIIFIARYLLVVAVLTYVHSIKLVAS
jgi:uncharacterized membrane protein